MTEHHDETIAGDRGITPVGGGDNGRAAMLKRGFGALALTAFAAPGRGARGSGTGSVITEPDGFGRAEPRNALADKLKPTPIEGVRAVRLPNRNLLITQGTSIPCVLETAMSSDVAGFASCVVVRDVMSDSGNVVLMEKGTQVFGDYRGNVRRGSKRLFVLWTRPQTPTGG